MSTKSRTVFLLMVNTALGAGCDDATCPSEFEVTAWCRAEGVCTVDGTPEDCASGDCSVAKGGTLEIPLDGLRAHFEDTKELEIFSTMLPATDVDPELFDVHLDDMVGTHLPPLGPLVSDTHTAIRWDPFPPTPRVLTLRYHEGSADVAHVYINLVDYACEAENREFE
jgi:hypothetical protein